MKHTKEFMCAILRNPEWMKNVFIRHGNGQSASQEQIATAAVNLVKALEDRLPDESEEPPGTKEFDLEGFLKNSEPPKAMT